MIMSNSDKDLDLMGDNDLDDLQELYEAEAGLDNLEDAGDNILDEEMLDVDNEQTQAGSEKTTSSQSGGRMWFVIGCISLLLILLLTLVLSPMLDAQRDRIAAANDIARDLNLTNSYATQALTSNGRFDPLVQGLENAENSVNRLVQPNSVFAKAANAFFGNNNDNNTVQNHWNDYKTLSDNFLSNEPQIVELKQKLFGLTNKLNQTVSSSVTFVEAVAKEGRNKNTGKSKDKYLFLTSEASNLNGILSRLSGSLRGYFSPNQNLTQLANLQSGLVVRLQDTLNRIVSNSAAVVSTAAVPLREQYEDLEARVVELGERAEGMSSSRNSLGELRTKSTELLAVTGAAQNQSGFVRFLGQAINILPILLGLLAIYSLWRYARAQAGTVVQGDAVASETLAEQQESILKLLDEMSALADGDLTVEAEVTDQITGAIADSVNFAVVEMRELVSQINRASIQVANESELAVSNAQSVSDSNISQAGEISSAATLMETVTLSMRKMSEQANSSSNMATDSLKAAEQGAQAVRDTIEGMENMREQIQDTSKRIKRLGESSQRIGDIVALIDDIAEQTNILSLNAAIQASMAGEAGRGFAVVSDEVQSLADRSTEATKKIGELVTTIQNDTNDAVLSMEKATQQVVSGTKVADSAGNALAEIEKASKNLSGLVEDISKGSNEQAEVVTKVSEQVSEVSNSSTDTSRKAQESANSIAKLLELAKELESSVSRFKLPAS